MLFLDDNTVLTTSLDSIYAELGIDKLMGSGRKNNALSEYAVYTPKSSYRSLQNNLHNVSDPSQVFILNFFVV